MIRSAMLAGATAIAATVGPAPLHAQSVPPEVLARAPALLRAGLESNTRAIRRDVPLTHSIQRAMAAGTRDFTGRPGPNYWQLQTDFTIEARLDPQTQSISGTETIAVHNNSPSELTQLVLRLDHNIFRARAERGSSVPAETTDGMVVTRLAVDGEAIDLAARGRRRGRRGDTETAPASASGLDRTVATIRLGKPIAAGAVARLEIEWHTKLPGGDGGQGHRMTQRFGDTLFQPTQWYPRLAMYDDLNGWDTNPYLGPAEFYNNFGRFDVRLDVPGGWIVSGTGVLQNPDEVLTATARERLAKVLDSDEVTTIVGPDEVGPGKATAPGDRLVWHFVADLVNDFAWATAENYVWKATRATIPGVGPIPIHMVFVPDRASRFTNAGPIARHALEFYSTLWIPYPFPQLTMQDGPSAGMEYPMVINSNQGAADHETGHQWWPMMVGTNETMYGWMDEGFNMYMNILSNADRRGRAANLDGHGRSYGQVSGDESEPPMMWNANYAGDQYGFQTYQKAPQMLSMLGGIVGDDAVQHAMREYARAWAFKHPSPWDYVFFMDNALGQDLGWFWYYWLWTTESVDGSIRNVSGTGSETVVTVHQGGQMPSPIVLRVEFAEQGPAPDAMPNAVMQSDGSAIVTWPVDVWFGGSRTFEAKLQFGPHAITKVTLDPGGRFPDRDANDNVWPR
ncbi:MAG TPA: M1 family metallopeptidase [Planctomycetota bacterium]|nr:M1 family metallopeptidase [Planctomycetota bacterium]